MTNGICNYFGRQELKDQIDTITFPTRWQIRTLSSRYYSGTEPSIRTAALEVTCPQKENCKQTDDKGRTFLTVT